MSSSSGIAENATRVPVGEPTINAFDDETATDAQAALDRAVEEQDVLDAREGMDDSGTTAAVPTAAGAAGFRAGVPTRSAGVLAEETMETVVANLVDFNTMTEAMAHYVSNKDKTPTVECLYKDLCEACRVLRRVF